MAWIIGIDEAGYGPNLGPFVMTAAAWRTERTTDDVWDSLAAWVRRAGEPEDDRFLVADSKVVYSPERGLAELERGVLALTHAPTTFLEYLDAVFPLAALEMREEFWFTGATPLPQANGRIHKEPLPGECGRFRVHGIVVCPRRFNALLDEHGSKGAVLAEALIALLVFFRGLDGESEPLCFFVDKHGGRNTYAAMLQHAFADGMVLAHEEGRERSVYDVKGLARPVRITFQPRADQEHFCVALASMVSKYVRELAMGEFNAYWKKQLPELKPTAGYPLDANRFLEDIRPAVERLNIPMNHLWRRK